MELEKRTIQVEDVGVMAGVLARMTNTAEAFSREVESLKGLLADKDKTIAELTNINKRLIDEKNAHVGATVGEQPAGGNGIAAG